MNNRTAIQVYVDIAGSADPDPRRPPDRTDRAGRSAAAHANGRAHRVRCEAGVEERVMVERTP